MVDGATPKLVAGLHQVFLGRIEMNLNLLNKICFVCGFASIVASIAVWFLAKSGENYFWSNGDPAHAERFGIFIGLWAPTFFILSERFERMGQKKD